MLASYAVCSVQNYADRIAMDLRSYTSRLPRGGVAELAGRLGISSIYLAQIGASNNTREASPELCVRIEAESGRGVRRWDLRPNDWHRIWPELIGSEGAPKVEVKAA